MGTFVRLLIVVLWRQRSRVVRFVAVGGGCLLIQLAILKELLSYDVAPFPADVVAFWFSAQFNFVLSYRWTWGDSRRVRGYAMAQSWLKFNSVALMATALNAGIYVGLRGLIGQYAGLGVAAVVSSTFVFAVNHWWVFPNARRVGSQSSRKFRNVSIAWFLPAHNEADNLLQLIPEVVEDLRSRGFGFNVIIVDDGSTDDTTEIGQMLADKYEEVLVRRHEVNRGYGAALRTGMRASLETRHSLIGFCDSDRQFHIDSIDPMLRKIVDADMVFGYRLKRADNIKRRLFSWLWQNFTQIVLQYSARDTNCGFKLFRREVVEKLQPHLLGEYATISAELIARAQRAGFSVAEVGIKHFPRVQGEQSGADYRVIIGSFKNLLLIEEDMRGWMSGETQIASQERDAMAGIDG